MASTDSKVFMFPEGGNNSSIDPALLMALNNNGGFGGNGSWLWIIFLFFLYPLLRNGGLFGNNGGFAQSPSGYIANMANNDVGREMLMNAIQGNGNAISNLATTLGCNVDSIQTAVNGVMSAVNQVGNQVGMTSMQTINAVQAGNNALGQQIAASCCENRLAICQQTNSITNSINEVGNAVNSNFANTNYQLASQICDVKQNTSNAAQSIKDAIGINGELTRNATQIQTQAIINKLNDMQSQELQDKIESLRERNSTLTTQLNLEHQNQYTAQVVGQAVAPINAALAGIQKEVDDVKCKIPDTVTTFYQPFTTVPNYIAWNAGLYGYNNMNGSIWS